MKSTPSSRDRQTVSATATADHRARLETLRDQLTTAIEGCEPRVLPLLARQLRATLTELAAFTPEVTGVEPGSIAYFQALRAERIAAAAARQSV